MQLLKSFPMKNKLIQLVGALLIFSGGFLIRDIITPVRASSESISQTKIVEVYPTLSDWQVLQMAIIKTESDFDSLATGKTGDRGIFQITPIYVKEANRILKEEKYTHEDAYSPKASLEMFNVVQSRHNPSNSSTKAIKLHNPGGDSIGYSKKVQKNVNWITQYEYVRSLVFQSN